jgi:predicted secreted protein
MADFPSLADMIADIKQGNPDMSDAAARRAARQALDDMMDQSQQRFEKRKAEGKENFKSGGKVKKYAKGGMCRGGRSATRGTKFSGVK